MADALGDLAIVPVTSSDTNYFLRKVTGLKIDKTYSDSWNLKSDINGFISNLKINNTILSNNDNLIEFDAKLSNIFSGRDDYLLDFKFDKTLDERVFEDDIISDMVAIYVEEIMKIFSKKIGI